jgi:Tfp pilus assembly protein FimT
MVVSKWNAFSTIEIVLILGLFAVIVSIFMPFTVKQLSLSKLESASKQMSSSIYLFQQYASSAKNDSSYGVAFSSNSYTLFEGDSISTASYTEVYDLPGDAYINEVNLTNSSSEVVFPKGEFKPDEYGYVRISDSKSTYRIILNKEGLIDIYAE